MATITTEQIDALNLGITLTISREDYEADYKKQLTDFRKKAQIKGFRKGQTPEGFIRKMYGRAILTDIVSKKMESEILEFLYDEERKLNFLGQPISSEDQQEVDFNPAKLEDYVFKFDLGLAPDFEVQGLGKVKTFERYDVQPDLSQVDVEFEQLRKRQADRQVLEEGQIEGNDLFEVEAVELSGPMPKENGVTNSFTLFQERLTADSQALFLGKAVGESVDADIYQLEEGFSEDRVRRYFMGLTDENADLEVGNMFRFTIKNITRVILPDPDSQEFLDKVFGEGAVASKAEAMDIMSKNQREYYADQAYSLVTKQVYDHLMEENQFPLPEEFLKRWLLVSNGKNTPERIEAGFESFKKSMRWTLIREKLTEQYNITVSKEEVRSAMAQRMFSYFGGKPDWMTDEMLDNMVDRMLKEDKNSGRDLEENIQINKLLVALEGEFNYDLKPISQEEFADVYTSARQNEEDEPDYDLLGEEE